MQSIKVVVVGDKGYSYSSTSANKTVLLYTYTGNAFPEGEYIPTVFDNYSANCTVDGTTLNVGLWDTSGTEEYHRNRPLNYPQTDIFILLFSVVVPDSFENIYRVWFPEVSHHCPNTPLLLVGHSIEKRDDSEVLQKLGTKGQQPISYKQGATLAKLIGAQKYLEVNMRAQNTVKQVFDDAMRIFLALSSKQPKKTGFFGTKKKTPPVFVWNPDVPVDKEDIRKMESAFLQREPLEFTPTEIVVPNYAAQAANINKEGASKSNTPADAPTLNTPPLPKNSNTTQPAASNTNTTVPSSNATPSTTSSSSATPAASKSSVPPSKDPNQLPTGWEEAVDDKDCVYYYNSSTNDTTWFHPTTGKMHSKTTLFFNKQSETQTNANNNNTNSTKAQEASNTKQQNSNVLLQRETEKQSPTVETKKPQQVDSTGPTEPMTLMLLHEDSNYAIDFDGISMDSLKSQISSEIELGHTSFIVECWHKKLNQFVKLTKLTQLEDTLSIRIKVSNSIPSSPSTSVAFHLVPVPKNDPEFQEVRDKIAVDYQQHHEVYVVKRIENKQLPISFKLVGLTKVLNGPLDAAFQACLSRLQSLHRTDEELKVRRAYHGTKGSNVESICKNGLLKVGNPKNPSQATDSGWFGDPKKGVYLSRYVEYTLQYSNAMAPLDIGERAKVVMFKSLPGRTFHVSAISQGMSPTTGYDSHSSPNWLEWYLFDEAQCCPIYVIELEAIENTRINANDGVTKHH